MKTTVRLAFFSLLCATTAVFSPAKAQSAFTYQGHLLDNAAPASGAYDLVFRLYASSNGGTPLGESQQNDLSVANGVFTTRLDFGVNAFNGKERFLEIVVNGVTLSPRQLITATPYSLFAYQTPWEGITGKPGSFKPGGIAEGDLSGFYPNPSIAPNAVTSSKLAFDSASLAKVSGGVASVSGANIGIDTSAPEQKLSVNGAIEAMQSGFKFPDGSLQRTAALAPEQVGFKSGLVGGALRILIDNSAGQAPAILAAPYTEEYAVLERVQVDSRGNRYIAYTPDTFTFSGVKLRRAAVANSEWAQWARLSGPSVPTHDLKITLFDSNGVQIVEWTADDGTVTRYELNLLDDGLPVEEITLTFAASKRPTRHQSLTLNGVLPELAPGKGAISGRDATSELRASGTPLPFLLLTSNIARHASVSYSQSGTPLVQTGYADPFETRMNPVSSSDMNTWFNLPANSSTRIRQLEYWIDPAGVSASFTAFRSQKAWPFKYTLRLADDGLPVEEYSFIYEVENP